MLLAIASTSTYHALCSNYHFPSTVVVVVVITIIVIVVMEGCVRFISSDGFVGRINTKSSGTTCGRFCLWVVLVLILIDVVITIIVVVVVDAYD